MVKLTFARGASIKDPQKLLNSSLEGNMRPAIDIREGDMILQAAHPGRGGGQRRSAHPTGSQEEVSSRLGGTTMPNEAHYTYQQLGRAHVPLIKDLLRVFGEAFDEVHTYQHHLPDDAYLMRLLGKDQFIALVAMSGPAVVGGLAAYVLDKFEQDRREIYIYDLAVQEDHRRRGVATGLIGELEWIAADRDVYVIFVQADLDDAPAIALYESLGTRETAHHFDIPVRLRSPRQTRMAARKPTIRFPRR